MILILATDQTLDSTKVFSSTVQQRTVWYRIVTWRGTDSGLSTDSADFHSGRDMQHWTRARQFEDEPLKKLTKLKKSFNRSFCYIMTLTTLRSFLEVWQVFFITSEVVVLLQSTLMTCWGTKSTNFWLKNVHYFYL